MKSIYQHYQKILQNEKYQYYRNMTWNRQPEDVFTPSEAKDFVTSMITSANKDSAEIISLIDNIPQNRFLHIVSTYLLGILLYDIPIVIRNVDLQLYMLTTRDSCLQKRFLYVWFLICLFHDLGYAYEENALNIPLYFKSPIIYQTSKSLQIVPDTFTTRLVKNYKTYRKQCMGVNDHGIYGGSIVYHEIFKKLLPNHNIKNVLRAVSNIITVHNIFFQNEKSVQATCYRAHHLDELIYKGRRCRKISLSRNPLLFLFDLVDSIDPMKSIRWEDLRDINIEYNDGLCIQIPPDKTYKGCRRRVNDIKSWLTDVKKMSDNTYKIIL